MEQLVHGGDWAGYRAQFGRDALDFSANVSPLGLPEGVAKAITAALPTADRYPDPLCRELRAKLALHEGVPADHILCGNGAADLIFRLVWARKPRRALVTAPTFAEYAAALETIGCTVERFILQAADDFAVPEAFLSAIDDRVDLVFLCQPNNPTGQLTPPDFVARILQRCTACGALLVLDECFLDFLPDHAQLTAKPLLGSGDLLILKAFTKLYGMAGVRLGYALSADTALLDAMQYTGQPWAVSSLAQAAGLAALDETAYDRACVPAFIDVALFGIAREAATNIVRHAGARRATLALSTKREGFAELVVDDDGKGLAAPAAAAGHHGLLGMRERARLLQGTFSASPSPLGGVRIAVSVPLSQKEETHE